MAVILLAPFRIEEEIKKSRFIVNAAPIANGEEAKNFITAHQQPLANHNCWAWKAGQQYRFNDDGEPSGTAGKPILSAIEGNDCDQIVIIVTRFFGGVKLGASGLIRAYGGSAARCLQQAPLHPLIHRQIYLFHCDYHQWPLLEKRLCTLEIIIDKLDFDASGVNVCLQIPPAHVATLQQWLADLTKGRVIATLLVDK
ncbi:YigZ family protein [Utexia brackfieldae]|uniref:IMPACT family protein n=1 Tax=Utexia brackfieldae TaxID=3074108 RepID=UPI00370D2EC8